MFVFSYFFVTDNDESAVFVFEFVESAEMFWIFDEFYFESAWYRGGISFDDVVGVQFKVFVVNVKFYGVEDTIFWNGEELEVRVSA